MSDFSDESDEATPRPEDSSSDRRSLRRASEGVDIDVSEFDEPSKVTDPIDWLGRDLDDSGRDLLNRSGRRSAGDPVPYGQFVQKILRDDDHRQKLRMVLRGVRHEIEQIRKVISPRWIEEVKGAVGNVKAAKKLLYGAVSAVVLSLGLVAGAIWQRSAQETEARIRLQDTRDDVAKLRGEINSVESRQSSDLRHEVELLRAEIERLREQLYRRSGSSHTSTQATPTALATMKGPVP